jgi:protein TonB
MPKTVSGVEYVQPPRPEYPATSRRMNEEGKVMLRVLVNERGRPEQAEVQKSSGYSRLDEAARQAAMRAVFKPHAEDGKPVAVYALIPINFSIQ